MADQYVNTASVATLAADISAAATSVSLSNFSGFPATFPYWAMIAKATGSAELVQVTAAAGSTLTIARAQGGTVAAAHVTGDTFEHVAPAKFFQDAAAHIEASTAHNTGSPIVGASDNGTLTNKTYRGAHTHVYTDVNPSGVSEAFKVTGDSAKASDGFVFDNSAADIARKAFLLKQAGIDRFAVYNDGTVRIASADAATRAGLDIKQDLAGDAALTTQVGAEVDRRLKVEASGKMTWGNGAAAGDTNLYRPSANKLKTDDALDIDGTLAVLGEVSALSTLKINNVAVKPEVNPDQQIFTASGTWNKPAGARWVRVKAQGGGGAGGGCATTPAGDGAVGGGGEGGAYAETLFDAAVLGASETVTRGAGGTGVSNGAGNSGGTSSFGTSISAAGGAGGTAGAAGGTHSTSAGGSSAQVMAGQILIAGQEGDPGSRSGQSFGSFGGSGGNSALGHGGGGTGTSGTGNAGRGYGGGGGGAVNQTGQGTARAGGAGRDGVVIVTTYFSG